MTEMNKWHLIAILVSLVVGAAVTAAIILLTQPGCPDPAESTPGFETDPYRPAFHYTPRAHWVNDPNGLVYYKGEWHLFYQYDRNFSVPIDISWGHAVSEDLVNWRELPVAIPADKTEKIFSGSVVVMEKCPIPLCGKDKDGIEVLVAAYTSWNKKAPHIQSQHIATSEDRGRTWTKFEGNPVLDKNMTEFRDPKVIRSGEHWIMLVQRSDDHHLEFYKSADLIHWGERISQFPADDAAKAGNTDGVWECPDLFDLPVDGDDKNKMTVLIVNINPGAPNGGSAGQYFIGSFDGTKFTNANPDTETRWLDYGMDYYATITWANAPYSEVIAIGWVSNWLYGQCTPTAPWKNGFSVPRLMKLKTIGGKVVLTQLPVANIEKLRGDVILSKTKVDVVGDSDVPKANGRAVDIEAEFTVGDAKQFGVKVHAGENQVTVIGYDVVKKELFVDRTRSGHTDFHDKFPTRHSAPLELRDNGLKLRILVDHNTVEVFAGDGEVAITDLVFPNPDEDEIRFYSVGGAVTLNQTKVWAMNAFQRLT